MSDKKRKSIDGIQKNDTLELEITEINNLGCGVGHAPDGRVVFVRGAVTGERITARIIKVASSYLVGRIDRVNTPSPYRLPASEHDCDAAARCGGCVYRHITYEHECEVKRDYVKAAFCKAGLPEVEIEDVRSTGVCTGYRNKAQYPVGNSEHGMIAGFYAGRTHDILPATECKLQPALFSEIVACVCSFCDQHGIRAYDENTGKGLLRHIYLRHGKVSGAVMVCLVINGDRFPSSEALADLLMARFPAITGILLNHNTKNTNVVLGDRYTLLCGSDTLEDTLCGLHFSISPQSFYQVNHDGAELLYRIAAEKAALTGKETLLDLYCGIGTIGLSMARGAARLVGIEIVPEAVECAKQNARRNGVDNAAFFCGDVGSNGDVSRLLSAAEQALGELNVDVAIIDPPRKGTTPALIALLAERSINRVVYVSCDVDTLARDCAIFKQYGYEIGAVTPVDMFPRTGHVESVVCLTRRLDVDMRR
ncbi:MAG: 23S rRNA (uracil(1939)-C(5))-methyltransferase RlmD [Clostridia bacterium]|nr:23S rRNA (uracil(1939)-C(5))-methyltransferase RlmD [Clostridia bacterium]